MTYIKKLVIHGFKSFANRTEIPFEKTMNVIVGPNGCGKSNVADALCFVLGRLSIKSIRAAKAANLLFSGTKQHKPAYEAFVELVFDNSDGTFPISASELSIKRILRKNGQSIYKINNETKTRQDLLELLSQAGIDPMGYNLVLQGEIAALIKMNGEGRREIIEEVAGISVYEGRKQRSLHELEKTDEKLKEVNAVLREKRNYLAQLERDKLEAQKYQKYEEQIKRGKATIFQKNIKIKDGEVNSIEEEIGARKEEINEYRKKLVTLQKEISELTIQIKQTDLLIESSTNREQESLHDEIANLKAEEASYLVRRDNFSNRIRSSNDKKKDFLDKIGNFEIEIREMSSKSPEIKKQQEKLKEYQKKLEELEKKRKRFYVLRGELFSSEREKEDKQKDVIEKKKEIELIERSIDGLSKEIKFEKNLEKSMNLKRKTEEERENLGRDIKEKEKEILEFEKRNAVFDNLIIREEKLKQDIVKLNFCPLCRSNITQEHKEHVIQDANKKIEEKQKEDKEEKEKNEKLKQDLDKKKILFIELERKENDLEIDRIKLLSAESRKENIKKLMEETKKKEEDLKLILEKILSAKKELDGLKNVEQEYDEEKLKITDISFSNLDVDAELSLKQREMNRLSSEIKSLERDAEESEIEFKKAQIKLEEIQKKLEVKEKDEQELYDKFQSLFGKKNILQDKQKLFEAEVMGYDHQIRGKQDKINDLNIQKARISAEMDNLRFEFKEFESFETFSCSIDEAKRKVEEAQQKLIQIGSVNLRALEVYDVVKEQVVAIEAKTATILKEKEDIMKIVAEIDKKKKKSFFQTLEKVNELFTRNFSQLSRKGEVFLELENNEDPFSAGLNILVKVAKGKYFDINSLSGGEKTLVALSLIFAIQEYKPYSFYIFDEIDAALDKRNSELLAALVKRYILSGQYIIITHNDALISEARILYGVTMQEGLSKVISIKLGEHEKFVEKTPDVPVEQGKLEEVKEE